MREYTCIVCGVKGIDRSPLQNKKHCSIECANRARYGKTYRSDGADCKFNQGVGCSAHTCENCGWNPKVEKIRKERIAKELREDGKDS